MKGGNEAYARTPEELELLFEDTLIIRDQEALRGLFEDGAVLSVFNGPPVHGGPEIVGLALNTWSGSRSFVAGPGMTLQGRDIALIVAGPNIHVMRRSNAGWRYVVVLLAETDERTTP